MIFAREKERIATLAAAIEQDRERMRMHREEVAAAARKVAGSPLGLAACFAVGLMVAPLLGAALGTTAGTTLGAARSRLGARGLAAAAAWGWQMFARNQAAMQSPDTPESAAPDQR